MRAWLPAFTPLRRLARAALLAVPALLAACGSERSESIGATIAGLRGLIASRGPQPDLRTQLTPEVLAEIGGPLLLVEVPSAPAQAGMEPAGTNRGIVTWAAADSTLLIIQGGVVTGTRGLGFDLMNADARQTIAALRGGGLAHHVPHHGPHPVIASAKHGTEYGATHHPHPHPGGARTTRVHGYLDGVGKVLERRFACRLAPAGAETLRLITRVVQTRVTTETCEGARGGRFVNRYWQDAAGQVVKSEQWVSPQVGYVRTEQVQ